MKSKSRWIVKVREKLEEKMGNYSYLIPRKEKSLKENLHEKSKIKEKCQFIEALTNYKIMDGGEN